MQTNFERWLAADGTYQKKVERECGLFPEGHLYPYFLTAMAFTHLAESEPDQAKAHLSRSAQLIKLGLPVAGQIVNHTQGDLLDLTHYDKQATTLSTVSLAIGLYRRAGGRDHELEQYQRHINRLLADALVRADGGPIASYPGYSWNFDTYASLLALRLAPELTPDVSANALWRKHELWIQRYAFDEQTQLPYSVAGFGYRGPPSPPRGCDVVMRVMLLSYVDSQGAQALFNRMQQTLEREVGQFYGFAEFPRGVKGWQDNDSGPIIMDMGLTATGLAVGAALSVDRPEIADRLCAQFIFREPLMLMAGNMDSGSLPGHWFWDSVKIDPQYFTGFLFGDAVLFYSLTWAPVGQRD